MGELEINKRIACSRKNWSIKEIMKSEGTFTKQKTFNTCILPCLTYGCEFWSPTKANVKNFPSANVR